MTTRNASFGLSPWQLVKLVKTCMCVYWWQLSEQIHVWGGRGGHFPLFLVGALSL